MVIKIMSFTSYDSKRYVKNIIKNTHVNPNLPTSSSTLDAKRLSHSSYLNVDEVYNKINRKIDKFIEDQKVNNELFEIKQNENISKIQKSLESMVQIENIKNDKFDNVLKEIKEEHRKNSQENRLFSSRLESYLINSRDKCHCEHYFKEIMLNLEKISKSKNEPNVSIDNVPKIGDLKLSTNIRNKILPDKNILNRNDSNIDKINQKENQTPTNRVPTSFDRSYTSLQKTEQINHVTRLKKNESYESFPSNDISTNRVSASNKKALTPKSGDHPSNQQLLDRESLDNKHIRGTGNYRTPSSNENISFKVYPLSDISTRNVSASNKKVLTPKSGDHPSNQQLLDRESLDNKHIRETGSYRTPSSNENIPIRDYPLSDISPRNVSALNKNVLTAQVQDSLLHLNQEVKSHFTTNNTQKINDVSKTNNGLENLTKNISQNSGSINRKNQATNLSKPNNYSLNKPDDISLHSENSMITPRGLSNPAGYCYLNCVIQLLRSCMEFCFEVEKYHDLSLIVTSQGSDNDKQFVNDFCKLIVDLRHNNYPKIAVGISRIQDYFTNASQGDDVMQCFMKLLTKLDLIINTRKHLGRTGSIRNKTPQEALDYYKSINSGFVFDSFYGIMSDKLVCSKCNKSLKISFQLFKTLTLPVPKSDQKVPLKDCLDSYFRPSRVETTEDSFETIKCLCSRPQDQKVYSIIKITHGPKYLFIYLNRGSYFTNGPKNNTFVSYDKSDPLQVSSESILNYELISVVDHIGDHENGHYYIKSCFEKKNWFRLSDNSVSRMKDDEQIVTHHTIVFLLKKVLKS